MEQKKQVGIWIRVSTDEQAQGDSPEHHEKRGRLYAESKGWEVVTVYHLEALTGKSVMGYAETKRMLEDVREGAITGLIFSKLARFARNTKELLEFADIFREEGADLISLQEAIDTSTPAGRLFYTMIAAMAQWEREEIVSRITASIPIRAKLGKNIGGHPSLGYKWENKEFVIDERHAPVRKLMYELFLKLRRKKAVAKALNEMGHRTQAGVKFTDTTVARLLRDPTAKGERRSNHTAKISGKRDYVLRPVSEWIMVKCPAIVSAELWDECNAILDQIERKQVKVGPQAKTLLAGYAVCAGCDRKMYVYHKTKSPVYGCSKCKNRIHVEDLDFIYHGELKDFLLTETSAADYLRKTETELQEKQKLLETTNNERQKLKKDGEAMVKMRVAGEWTKETFVEHFRPIEERIKQIDNWLPELEAEIDFIKTQYYSGGTVLENARNLYREWHTMEFEERRTVVELITQYVRVGKQEVYIELSYLPTRSPKAAEPAQEPEEPPEENTVKRQYHLQGGTDK